MYVPTTRFLRNEQVSNLKGKTVYYPSSFVFVIDSGFKVQADALTIKVESKTEINGVICINKNEMLLPLTLDHLFHAGDTLYFSTPDSSASAISDSKIILCMPGEGGRSDKSKTNARICIRDLNTVGDSIVNLFGHIEHIESNKPLDGKDRFVIRLSDGIFSSV
jgi:hypothetical protein